jgi:hypothetical protein
MRTIERAADIETEKRDRQRSERRHRRETRVKHKEGRGSSTRRDACQTEKTQKRDACQPDTKVLQREAYWGDIIP